MGLLVTALTKENYFSPGNFFENNEKSLHHSYLNYLIDLSPILEKKMKATFDVGTEPILQENVAFSPAKKIVKTLVLVNFWQ